MEEISIVKKRSRLWPILLALVLLAVIVLCVLWLMGTQATTTIGWNDAVDLGRGYLSGTA